MDGWMDLAVKQEFIYANSERSGETVQMRRLARAFTVHLYTISAGPNFFLPIPNSIFFISVSFIYLITLI